MGQLGRHSTVVCARPSEPCYTGFDSQCSGLTSVLLLRPVDSICLIKAIEPIQNWLVASQYCRKVFAKPSNLGISRSKISIRMISSLHFYSRRKNFANLFNNRDRVIFSNLVDHHQKKLFPKKFPKRNFLKQEKVFFSFLVVCCRWNNRKIFFGCCKTARVKFHFQKPVVSIIVATVSRQIREKCNYGAK